MYDYRCTLLSTTAVCALSGCALFSPAPPLPEASPKQSYQPQLNIPNAVLSNELPVFADAPNKIQISDSFNYVDPSWVIGAIVNRDTKTVMALDNFLKKDHKPVTTSINDIVFKNLIENGAAASAEWLTFVKATVNSSTRAEITVARAFDISISSSSIDKVALLDHTRTIKEEDKGKYGVIIGYSDYILSATYFRNSGASTAASGFGAKIDGSWYSKSENSSIQHRIVAVWAPLPYVLEAVKSPASTNLTNSTGEAIRNGGIQVEQIHKVDHALEL